MAYLIKTHEKSGLLVCSNGSVFIPESRKYKEHWTCGSLCRKYRIVHHNGKNYSVHRMVAETFIENPNNYPTVDHIDRNPLNNDVSNLRWATSKMNIDNQEKVDNALKRYGVRRCDNPKEYYKAYGIYKRRGKK